MASSGSRIDLADWKLRSPELDAVSEYDDGRPIVAMGYAPSEAAMLRWLQLRERWLALEPHPHILDALAPRPDGGLLLRYAALHWKHPQLRCQADRRTRAQIAAWGVQVTNAYLMIRATPEPQHFLHPVVRIDLGGAARLGFLPVVEGPPAARGERPRCDERSSIYVIGVALRRYCDGLASDDAVKLRTIIDRCIEPEPANRFSTLEDLRDAWRAAGGNGAVRAGEDLASWTLFEEAVGWLAVGRPARAVDQFERVLELDPHLGLAEHGLRRAFERMGVVHGSVAAHRADVPIASAPGSSVISYLDRGERLEAERSFRDALGFYLELPVDRDNESFLFTARARCYLALGAATQAIDHARRALAVEPRHVEAHAIHARGLLLAHEPTRALAAIEPWLAVDDTAADAHYTRGRALLALGRSVEARDAFDRASALNPEMIEAMLLRREAERSLMRVREAVGTQPAFEIELPDHLERLRDALMNGRIQEVITILEHADHDADPAAKLAHARCLAFEKRFREAVAIYDLAANLSDDPDHERALRLGKADALLALDRAEEALALFDLVGSDDLEALEGRAAALQQLGRAAEAEAAFGQVIAASGGRARAVRAAGGDLERAP